MAGKAKATRKKKEQKEYECGSCGRSSSKQEECCGEMMEESE